MMMIKYTIFILTLVSVLSLKEVSISQHLSENESKVIIFAVGLSDTRRIPVTKDLLISAYEINIILKGNDYVKDFINVFKKYRETRQCEKCTSKFVDTRIYIQIYKGDKLNFEAEICDGGECIRINNTNYCLNKEFYDFYLNYIPKINQRNYAPAGHFNEGSKN
jgi:hypothetical protein